jgi:uncharacterized membrane protein
MAIVATTKGCAMTLQHIGLLLTFVGTVAVAFSVRARPQYEGEMGRVVKKLTRGWRLVQPTETTVLQFPFYGGLALIAIGVVLQW